MKNITLTRRAFLRATGAASVLAALSSRSITAAASPDKPINLLFIMTDQQRFDALGRAGNALLKTPHLDALAREGVYFENAYTCCPVCVPARAAILTGHTIESTRVRGNGDCEPNDGANLHTFDNILSRTGYHTEYYGKWHMPYKWAATYANTVRQVGKHARGAAVPGLAQAYRAYLAKYVTPRQPGKGEFLDNYSHRPYAPDPIDWRYGAAPAATKTKKPARQDSEYGCLGVPSAHTRTSFTAEETIAALERIKDKPFSLTCSFGPPHPPMVLPKPYYGMYPVEHISAPKSIEDPMDNSPYAARAARPEMRRYRNKKNIRYMISDYYGLVAEVDLWVGRILTKLKELGLAERTLVIFTSDHGEMLGDHGMHSKMVLYEGAAHIPLLMRLPGVIASGTVVTAPVSHVDLFATILDYLQMPAHKSEGRSLRKLIEGGRDDLNYCVSEWNARRGPTLMIRTKDFKYITTHLPDSPAVDALYDLRADPLEMNNLIGKNPRKAEHLAQARAMKMRLIEWLTKIHSPRLKGLKARKI